MHSRVVSEVLAHESYNKQFYCFPDNVHGLSSHHDVINPYHWLLMKRDTDNIQSNSPYSSDFIFV